MPLNFNQRNAIELINGPCLILAGAGSGKTKVIINKIIYLINYCQCKPGNIIAVTFTNKAAHEIKVRLAKNLNYLQIKKMIISTFHSLGLEIIKKEINALEFDSNFSLFDEKDQMILLKKICNKNIKNNTKLLKKLVFMISFWKNKFLTPLQVQLSAQSNLEKDFGYLYEEYNSYLRKSNILDFDDLICIPTTLLKNNQIIQNRWQKKISYLLVDEYQDTNNSQYELIKMLTNINSNFTLVGDDDQSIYSWRGAKPQNIFLLKEDFPNLKVIKMEQNYRSYGRILKAANKLISNNLHYFKKNLFSTLEYGKKIKVIIGQNEEIEAEKIADKIINQCSDNIIQYKDYAILYRGNYQSQILEKTLLKKNIPYDISSSSSFFSRPEIKDLLSYLRLIVNPNDNYAFIRILNIPHRKIGLTTLNKLEELSIKKNKSLFEISNDIEIKKILRETTIKKIKNFISWVNNIIALSHLKPDDVLDNIINDTKYELWLTKTLKEPKKIQKSINNIYTLSNWLKDMLKGNEFEKPMNLLQIVKKMTLRDVLEKKIKKNQVQKNRVQLMTLHSSKGLEFSSVFIIGMNEGILPNIKSINNDNIEEERRLTYVGMTRAKKELFFTYCQTRIQYGQKLNTLPSRFLFELPQEDLQWDKDIYFHKFYKK
ncbi:DNA helicase Rep [Buchnera aphidicola]|uniref:DNA 3'-5' helicase n=1 Tax=Buchnera aphidicola subsp. Rhopalosiphum maidis TaxID=118109 RepID=A0A3G2I6C0_BUCRM|nr:DNA helicase Rep [Buchnera aphidicola]AYN24508.1 DNA helicase Rep [Buchnera aphidicola (Rhopalosiphum maidis)]